MTLRRKFAIAVAVQSTGPISLFFTIWFIARQYGVEAQGQFSATKSFIELLVACFLFGLPQSFVYGINKIQIHRNQLVRWIIRYGLNIVLIVGVFLWIAENMQWKIFELSDVGEGRYIYFSIAVAGLVVFGLFRGVYLTVSDGWRFSALTISPSIILTGVIFLSIAMGKFSAVKSYAIMGLLSALIGLLFLRRYIKFEKEDPLPWNPLLKNGAAVFLHGLFAVAQPYFTLTLLRNHSGNYTDVAYFSLAMYIYQAGVIPLTMVAPMLYNRWSSTAATNSKSIELKQLLWGVIPITGMAVMGWLLMPLLLDCLFDKSYASAEPTIRVMIISIPLLYVVHVGTPMLMSMGYFWINVLLVVLKLSVCLIALAALLYLYPEISSQAAATSWLISEFIVAILIIFILRKIFSINEMEREVL